MKSKVNSFEDLNVYQAARRFQLNIFKITQDFPKEEMFSLTDQIRRASRSIGANIAEAWSKRRYPSHFVSKLSDADAEQQETRHWLHTALDCEYLTQDQENQLLDQLKTIGAQLGKMMQNPESWIPEVRSDS